MKRFIAAVLFILILSGISVGSLTYRSFAENAEPDFKQIRPSIQYSETYNRYANLSSIYTISRADAAIHMFNAAIDHLRSKIPVYLYFVESSRSHPMKSQFDEDSPYYLHLCKNLHLTGADHLKYTTFDEFCNYFYSTDHHWNCHGSYQGYVDIVHMLCGDEEEVLTPKEEVTLPVIFNGSYAKTIKSPTSTENFSLYRFDDLPPYISYINGKRRKYDNIQNYLNGRVSHDLYANHYQLCYGGNYAHLVLESGQNEKHNLLMFTNSIGAPVKSLLINHFNRIVVIDLRYYCDEYKARLSLQQIVDEFDIDQILILGESQFFVDAKDLAK